MTKSLMTKSLMIKDTSQGQLKHHCESEMPFAPLRFVDPENASRWGWVNFDWSDANAIWQDQEPHMNEHVLVEQCKLVKAKGTVLPLASARRCDGMYARPNYP